MSRAVSTPLVAALDDAWSTIHHPDVPEVVVTLGSGTDGRGTAKYGHYATRRWQRGDDQLAELFVSGEGLQRGPGPCSPPCCTRPPTGSPTREASRTRPGKDVGTTPASDSSSGVCLGCSASIRRLTLV